MKSVESAICNRILKTEGKLLIMFGFKAVLDAIEEEVEFVGEVDEIGTSDVSCWVANIARRLDRSSFKPAPIEKYSNLTEDF